MIAFPIEKGAKKSNLYNDLVTWKWIQRMEMIGMDVLLKLPVSISNWIIIEDALHENTDRRLYIKVFRDCGADLPIFKVSELCVRAHEHLLESDFQYAFGCYVEMRGIIPGKV